MTFSFPFNPPNVKSKRPYLFRRYKEEKLGVEVVLKDPELQAVWVRLRLGHAWTDEQVDAAFASYGSGWNKFTLTIGNELVQALLGTGQAWISQEGVLGVYSKMGRTVTFYAPELLETYRRSVEKERQRREAVPEF